MTSQPLAAHLDALSAALDDGVDLGAVLAVLVDDLTLAVPSFLGLQLTMPVPDGSPVVLSTMDSVAAPAVQASLLLPLGLMGVAATGTSIVFYAAAPGVFADLAATTREEHRLDGAVILDGHLDPVVRPPPGFSGLDEMDAVNQAIGVLVHHGHTPDEASALIAGRAARHGETPEKAALALIENPPPA